MGIERASLGKPIVPIVVTCDQKIFFLARGKNTDILNSASRIMQC